MAKFTYKEIKEIIETTPESMAGLTDRDLKNEVVGYYKKPAANWSYKVCAIIWEDLPRLAVFTFGEICTR